MVRYGLAFAGGIMVGIGLFHQDFEGLSRIVAIVLNGLFFVLVFGIGLEFRLNLIRFSGQVDKRQ